MVVEVVNRNQQVIRAGLGPRTVYSRVIVLSLQTGLGPAERDNKDSGVLASRGIVHGIVVHAHARVVNSLQDAVIYFGINREGDIGLEGGVTFRQSLIDNFGGPKDGLAIQGLDPDYELTMGVQFIGDKTRLGASVRSGNNFATRYQLIFTISEG